jgi:hypothetical protein
MSEELAFLLDKFELDFHISLWLFIEMLVLLLESLS